MRLLLVALNTALALGLAPHVTVAGTGLGLLDLAGGGLVVATALALGVRASRNLRALARLEPAAPAGTPAG